MLDFGTTGNLRNSDLERATELFVRILGFMNDLSLLTEAVAPHSGALTGNFPQAFSHVGLITAALELDRFRPSTLRSYDRTSGIGWRGPRRASATSPRR